MTRQDIRDLLELIQQEIDEIDADLPGLLEELREIRERIAEARRERSNLLAQRAAWRAALKEMICSASTSRNQATRQTDT